MLPPAPTEQEIETFVTLMGHFGRQTGFPGLRVTVAGPDALHNGADTDFLIIGAGDDQPAFSKLGLHLPVSLGSGQVQVHDTQASSSRSFTTRGGSSVPTITLNPASSRPAALPTPSSKGIESPYDIAGSRSIVAIHLRDASTFEPFITTFLNVQQSSDISGSVSVLHGTEFQSFRVGSQVYHVGSLPWFTQLRLWAAEYPWLIAVIVVVLAFLLAIWTRQWLRMRARARLTMMEN